MLEPSLTTIQLQNRATDQDVLVQVRLGSTTLVPRNMFAKLHLVFGEFLSLLLSCSWKAERRQQLCIGLSRGNVKLSTCIDIWKFWGRVPPTAGQWADRLQN